MSFVLCSSSVLSAQPYATRLRWVPDPRIADGGWVSDPARHLRPETVASINQAISQLERETTAEIAVVVIDTLDGLEPGDAALLLHRRWGVGKLARDNGIVLLWSPKMRRTYVAVGYGLEGVLTDARAGRIQDDDILPHFRRNDFDAGMIAGVNALAAAARQETYSGLARARALSPVGGAAGATAVGAVAAMLAAIGGFVFVRRRPPKCPRGHGRMRRLSEKEDDAFLLKEAILEETLGSMDYVIFICDQCPDRVVVPKRTWFTAYSDCPQCKRRTVAQQARELVAATYTSTGEREVTRTCRNCGWTTTTTETIPMKVHTTSSSGGGSSGGRGGGSSFGGGSSGGGGAGRSY